MSAPQSTVPCPHRTHHMCGTRIRYIADRCRCAPCREANTADQRRARRLAAYGRWTPFVDAQPARTHVRALMAAGVGTRRIADVSGVSLGTLMALLYVKDGHPPSARIRPTTAAALLAVTPDDQAPGRHVDATGTRRRLQALAVTGWSAPALARVIGLEQLAVLAILRRDAKTTRATADTVAAGFDRWLAAGPPTGDRWLQTASTKARRAAAAAGWLPAAAWDDFDDVDARPDAPAEVDAMTALAEDVEWLATAGGNWHSVPARLGRSRYALERALHRSGRHDLVAALTANTPESAAA